MTSDVVSEAELEKALKRIRALRLWAVQSDIDPWALRQALLMALEMDTKAALGRGIRPEALRDFDARVKADIRTWLEEANR